MEAPTAETSPLEEAVSVDVVNSTTEYKAGAPANQYLQMIKIKIKIN
jgi:hypothetical protein